MDARAHHEIGRLYNLRKQLLTLLYRDSEMFALTSAQLSGLKSHEYRSQGVSVLESLALKRFWRWLVTFLPRSVAPNLITFTGVVIAMVTSLAVVLPDLNAEGKVRVRVRVRVV